MRRSLQIGLLATVMAFGLTGTANADTRALLTAHLPADAIAANFAAPLPDEMRLRLAITLPMHNLTVLENLLTRLQDRGSAEYRHYLTVAEFTSRFGPTQAEYQALTRFAATHGLGVSATSANRFVLDVDAPVRVIQQAFGVRMGLYRHPNRPGLFYAPDREPRMEIGVPVLHISGLDNAQPPVAFARRRPDGLAQVHANGSGPNGDFIASDMRQAYYGGAALTGAGQSVGLIAFAGFNMADVKSYFGGLGQSLTVHVAAIDTDGVDLNCVYPKCDDFEQSIDIEQVIGMAPGLSQVLVYEGSTVIDILNRMATDNTAKSLSSSYGWGAEAQVEDPVYMEFAAQGQTFFSATGDMGAQLKQGGVWPADDAHVIAVGGTQMATQWNGGPWLSESAWGYGGGGPSPDGVRIRHWQLPYVNASNMASPTWRNVPDVSAEANYDNYICFDQGCGSSYGGTSFAAPRWAAFVALANEKAASAGAPGVGFIDPRMYRIAAGEGYNSNFHDITQGSNGTYPAVIGFDDATGLGSPQAGLIAALAAP